MAPRRVTEAYYLLANYVESGYKNHSLTVWPLQRRLGPVTYALKHMVRQVTNTIKSLYSGGSTHFSLKTFSEKNREQLSKLDPVTV